MPSKLIYNTLIPFVFLGIKGPFSELILFLIWWCRLKWVYTSFVIWENYKFLICLKILIGNFFDSHTAQKHILLLLLVTFLSFFLFLPFPHKWKIVRTGDNRFVLHCKHIVFPSQNAMMNIYKANKSDFENCKYYLMNILKEISFGLWIKIWTKYIQRNVINVPSSVNSSLWTHIWWTFCTSINRFWTSCHWRLLSSLCKQCIFHGSRQVKRNIM